MGFFDKKKSLSREEFRKSLRKAPSSVPGSGIKFYRRERENMEKNFFGKQYGGHISRQDFKHRIKGLKQERNRAKTEDSRKKISRTIDYFEKHGGIKK